MPGPINLDFPVVASVGATLAASGVPLVRCEILHKVNKAMRQPERWRDHDHLRRFALETGHLDTVCDTCAAEIGLTAKQRRFVDALPSWMKEVARQRMVAAIKTGDRVRFRYQQGDADMREADGTVEIRA